MTDRFVFAGNRPFVLRAMLECGLDPDPIYVVEGSYLHRYVESERIVFKVIPGRHSFISDLGHLAFDYFVANGLPVILPISQLTEGTSKQFINVHPSPLPDLRGADPIPGAILLGRDSGATCHLMNDGVDTGPIIASKVIPFSADLDAGLIYQLCFEAEVRVFRAAFELDFVPRNAQRPQGDEAHYSFRSDDLRIRFDEPADQVVRRIRAFSNQSKGAWFAVDGKTYRVFDAEPVSNTFLVECFSTSEDGVVVLNYEGMLVVRLGDGFVKLKQIDRAVDDIPSGSRLA